MGPDTRLPNLLAALICLSTACSEGDSGAPANAIPPLDHVLLVTLDTLRADHVGAYGYPDAGTPTLDGLAARGALFASAYTTCNVTGPSHASIMTGLYPQIHGMLGNAWRLDERVERLATLLSGAGFRTAAFVSTAVLSRAAGLDHGFETYDQEFLRDVSFKKTLQRRGDETVDAALAWLDDRPPGRFFLWLHLFDAHAPYDPPADFWPADRPRLATDPPRLGAIFQSGEPPDPTTLATIRDLYHAEVRFLDAQLARLLAHLDSAGLREQTLVVVVADHGEELADHQNFFEHNRSLYEGVARVPLLVVDPRVPEADRGRRVAQRVQILDVMPTVLESVGLPVPDGLDARSLSPYLRGLRSTAHRDWALVQRPPNEKVFRRGNGFAWLDGPHKILVFEKGPTELYDLSRDPAESTDLFDEEDPGAVRRRADALALVESFTERGDASRQRTVPTREHRRMLEALGYLRE